MTIEEVFSAFPTLQTARLVLRQVSPADAAGIFAYKSDPAVTGRYGREPHAGLEQTLRWIDGILNGYERRESLMWVLEPKVADYPGASTLPAVAGSVILWNFDEQIRCVELGYELHPAAWGMGLAPEACTAVVDFGFSRMGVNRIEACPLGGNPASSRVLQKLSFRYEGNLRQRVYYRGAYQDMLYYSLLQEEWRQVAANRA